jgi:hypothetical protein
MTGTGYESISWSTPIWSRAVITLAEGEYKKSVPPTVKQIIFQPELKTTVVIWNDDSRTVVKCSDGEDFVPEVGFAMALVKKQFPNRAEFLRMIKKAYVQPVKIKTKKESK